MSEEVTIRVVRGHPATQSEFEEAIHSTLGDALSQAGAALIASGMQATPVVSGNLRRSWALDGPNWRGAVGRMRVGPGAVYAHRVNTVGRSAGYIEEGLAAGSDTALSRLEAGVRERTGKMWSNR